MVHYKHPIEIIKKMEYPPSKKLVIPTVASSLFAVVKVVSHLFVLLDKKMNHVLWNLTLFHELVNTGVLFNNLCGICSI